MAVVSKKSKTDSDSSAPVPAQPAVQAEPKTLKLELRFLGRYFFQNQLYEKGKVYEFDEEDARELLTHTVDHLPVFTFAKPRVKYVEVPADDGVVKVKPARVSRKTMTLEQYALEQQGKDDGIAPKNIDLSDDDPEIAAKLARADAGEDVGQEI